MLIGYFDGAITKNPGGIASLGFVLYRNHEIIHIGRETLGSGPTMTSNVAEWAGLARLLSKIKSEMRPGEDIIVKGDSQMVIRQASGRYKKPKFSKKYFSEYLRALPLIEEMPDIKFEWIPREQNIEADELSHIPGASYPNSYTATETGGSSRKYARIVERQRISVLAYEGNGIA